MARLSLPIQLLDPDLPVPRYANPGDAGLDLYARQSIMLPAHARALMPTGIAVAIPEGWVGLVHPRSGWALRHGLTHANSPGTIDAGYRGEIRVPLLNTDPTRSIRIRRGDRIGQLLLQEVARAELKIVDRLPDGERNQDGFGSSGR
ncbi:dUTP diphosphatase [Stomatohabitans albus]|uniref:dUTP diphosphatase n=1 Tax=Stomatohabitans albus TaxID=3110766 RepID=UPI003AB9B35D